MVEDHETHIEKVEEHADAHDPAAADHAQSTLPVLEEHLELAQAIEEDPRG